MRFELRFPKSTSTRILVRVYDLELDDIRSILEDICEAVASEGQFVVSGFGQDPWPVDVATDLVVFLEQLPDLLHAIADGVSAELDFYEQGIERSLSFTPVADDYAVKCASLTGWHPNPELERISRVALHRMLTAVLDEFLHQVRQISPELLGHPWLKAWLLGTESYDK